MKRATSSKRTSTPAISESSRKTLGPPQIGVTTKTQNASRDRLGPLVVAAPVLEAGLFVESACWCPSLSPNRDCWPRNYKAVRIGVNRAADVLSSFDTQYIRII